VTRVLFVDDEPNVLQGLRRMLRGKARDWSLDFANGGSEALAMMGNSPSDIVVSDMRMPGMDGPELLSRIRNGWPAAVRMVLSGHSDQEAMVRSVGVAHQYLTKPCEAATLVGAIEKAISLRQFVRHPDLLTRVTAIGSLPVLPETYRRIGDALQQPQVSLREVGALIEEDVALSAKILQVVNSAFFGSPRQVASAGEAAVLLGVDVLSALVLGVRLFDAEQADAATAARDRQLARQALSVSSLARRIARDLGAGGREADEAFLAGMLHGVGEIVLLQDPGCDATARAGAEQAAETAMPASDLASRAGAYLLGLWNFADAIVEAVAYQRQPALAPPPGSLVLAAVHVALHLSAANVRLEPVLVDRFDLHARIPEWQSMPRAS
jgi:HD-like signal output (HDOD) protein/ActR/RegA family two-component response regulator